jgi:hypothetical protein
VTYALDERLAKLLALNLNARERRFCVAMKERSKKFDHFSDEDLHLALDDVENAIIDRAFPGYRAAGIKVKLYD